MKKLFLAIAAVATLLASCSKDDGLTGVSKSQVTFTVSSPEMATRYGEGEKATTLYYAVYDAVENATEKGLVRGLSELAGEDFTGGKKQVTINLVEGRTYDIIFYAQNADGSPYEPDWVERTLEIKTPTDLDANQETYDAFYAHVDNLKVGTAAINETVYLRRPFAQLNVLTNDLDKGAAAGIDIAQTSVTVKNIYTKMNLFTDKVDPASEATVTYALSDVLKDDNGAIVSAVVDNTTYHWLTMNYLLVNDKKMVDVEFTMTDSTVADGKDNKLVRNYSTVPVERNHRTNIYGSIITNPAKFNVEIKPEFLKPDHNVNGGEQYTTTVATADELQKAIDNAKEGRTIITFEQDIDANSTRSSSPATITISQKENVDLVIDGAGYKFDGTFYVDGNSRYTDAETLMFANINFEHLGDDAIDFISCNNAKDGAKRYAHNVTVIDCTFTGNGNYTEGHEVVGMRFRQCYNISVVNSSFTKVHSLMWATGCGGAGISLDRVTVADSYSGASFGTTANIIVKNSNITVEGNGLRADGPGDYKLAVENSTINAEKPIIIRNITGGTYNVALEGKNTLASTGLYDVVFTNGKDDEAYAAPTGKWSITGAEGLNVYPTALTEGYNASSSEQLSQAIAAGATTVNLEAGEYKFPASNNFTAETVINCEEGTVFTGTTGLNINGATVNGAEFSNPSGYAVSGTINGTFKNCTFDSSEALRWCYTTEGQTSVFENCVIKTDFRGIHFDTMNGDVIFRNCEINGFNAYGGEGTITFEGCTFGYDQSNYNGLNIYSNTNIKDCKFVYVSIGKTNFIDMEGTGKTLTIENCTATLDGVPANVADFVGGSKLANNTVVYK